jgi:hypothetical protein
MILVFITPIQQAENALDLPVPGRSVIHGLLFWGFVHIWLSALKKQWKFEKIKRNALWVVLVSALIAIFVSELFIYGQGDKRSSLVWNLVFDLTGTALGILTFSLLYRPHD